MITREGKAAARRLATLALKSGKLKAKTCEQENCDAPEVEMHHAAMVLPNGATAQEVGAAGVLRAMPQLLSAEVSS